MIQTASILGVHRETLYYWIKKGWLKPKRDYRNYPVFTVLDIENLISLIHKKSTLKILAGRWLPYRRTMEKVAEAVMSLD